MTNNMKTLDDLDKLPASDNTYNLLIYSFYSNKEEYYRQ